VTQRIERIEDPIRPSVMLNPQFTQRVVRTDDRAGIGISQCDAVGFEHRHEPLHRLLFFDGQCLVPAAELVGDDHLGHIRI
jgi:hypothetical protein